MKLLPLLLLALAFTAPSRAAEEDASREREQIRAARATVQSQYAAEEQACHRRFAVNDCLDKAKKVRNDALADLRRQELALNEASRRRKTEERRREIDERSSPERLEAAERRRQEALAAQREQAAQKAEQAARRASDAAERAAKAAGREVKPVPAAPGPAASGRAVEPRAGALRTPQPQGGEAARNRAEYEARIKDAQDRKARILQRKAERAKPPASSLPTPAS
ncbi:hypothetical protein FN976_25990 [Caenimonas sedimenti]|uniref:Uncharacterized protein n=1 Tax=Caenimonas sedimenti TaxID=2596921 RepID=A0A562ZG91_9BURK|nr:hypothetical protein [Caenimonas sedimenti]TWO66985.1 hypothetical protein FN976_25990 [Caenimonas sedimenti]